MGIWWRNIGGEVMSETQEWWIVLVRLKPAHRISPCSRGAYEAIRANSGEAIEIVDGKVCLARGER